MGRVLGLDLGEAQIGLAISDDHKILARGLTTLKGKERRECMAHLGELIRRLEVEEIVVGLPKNMNGSLGSQAQSALSFAERLRKEFGLPVQTWDERLTTVSAKRALIDSGARRSARGRDALDRISATIILQNYLDGLSLQGSPNPFDQR
jgi:putative Holliday junction resolvase